MKLNHIIFLLFFLVLVCFLYQYFMNNCEYFHNYYHHDSVFNYPSRVYCPTRNMSYDLRCTPSVRHDHYAFNNSSVIQHPSCQQKCL